MVTMDKRNDNITSAFEELQAINQLIERVCKVRETNHIMSIIIDELIRLTGAGEGVINLIPKQKTDDLVTVVRRKQDVKESQAFRVDDLICGWVLKNRATLKIDDLDSDERFSGLTSDGGRVKSILCSPMLAHGEMVGLTTLVRDEQSGPFTDDQARLVGIISSQSAQMLKNALLLEELARKNQLLQVNQEKLRDDNIRLQAEMEQTFAFENIIGKSPQTKRALVLASKVSVNESPVLITGPTGTGKELIARAIHFNSRRKNRPFVIKNCGVRTETLLESELFGHTKGAFTGADRPRQGVFKEADGGTIFLDEIGDAPLSTQAAILRVIENGEVRPVGAARTDRVDVRVISATNRDLRKMIEEDLFREDLFYRLNTVTIELSPLAHRSEDIPLLVHHFINQLRAKLGNDNLNITPEAMCLLEEYDWPGNVRQLQHEIERAAVVCSREGVIDRTDLSPEIRGVQVDLPTARKYHGRLRDTVEDLEKQVIASTLEENDGNILQTSKLLGLTRKGLKDKMARYRIK